ncbi:hypothetical protein ACNANV_16240 [Curtobacterium flaccumfaciens pv. flaccumfaciens]
MSYQPDDDEIQKMLDAADENPDEHTPDQVVNLARGRDKDDEK